MTTTPTALGRDVRPLRTARRLVLLLAAAVIATTVAGAWFVVRARQAGGLLIGDEAAGDPAPVVVALSVWGAVTVATALAWSRWMDAVGTLLADLGRPDDHPGRWATLGWMVPPWSLFAPARVVMSLWRRSSTGSSRRPRLVAVWWLLYLVGNPAVIAVAALTGSWRVAAYSSAAWIAAGLVALRLVDRITARSLMAFEIERGVDTGWRRATGAERMVPALAALVAVVGFVAYQGFAISEALVGAINGWQVEDAVPGLCFGGVTGERVSAFVDVPCGQPHRGEVVGAHLVQGGPEAEWDEQLLELFAVGLCRTTAEAYTGVRAEDLEDSLVVTWPTRSQWRVNGERDVSCLLLMDEGTTGSVADPAAGRRPAQALEPGDCFVEEAGWMTVRLVECVAPATRATGAEIVDRTVTAPYPQSGTFERVAERACPAGSDFDAPSVAEWQRGLRRLLCTERV